MRTFLTASGVLVLSVVLAGAACAPTGGTGGNPPPERMISSITWVGCDTIPRDAEGGGTTPVEICAADYARSVGPGNAGNKGQAVARMRNLGTTANEARWKLRPGRRYIIAAYTTPTGSGTYKIWHEGPGPPVASGIYHGCGHGGEPPTSSATFGACEPYGSLQSPKSARSGGPSDGGLTNQEHVRLSPASGPAWISCTDGCCTTDTR